MPNDLPARHYSSNLIIRYPPELPATALRHRCVLSTDPKIDFFRAQTLLVEVCKCAARDYSVKYQKQFDRFHLDDGEREWMKSRFWTDHSFRQALALLSIDSVHSTAIGLPWWAEIAASEVSHNSECSSAPFVTLAPRHSYQTQLVRSGIPVCGIVSASVGGIIETSDDKIVIGLRGGVAFANTYHINAGALRLLPGLVDGTSSIYSFYANEERCTEFGLDESNVRDALVLGRIFDTTIEDGPIYIFLVRINRTFAQLEALYEANHHEDKGEHTCLVAISKDPAALLEFIKNHYRGPVADKSNRSENERYLLHPGALALTLYAGETPESLATLYRFNPNHPHGYW